MKESQKRTILDILSSKNKKKLVCTTAYIFPMAKMLSDLDYDILLIGDSLANAIQGHANTIPATLEDMIYHSKMVVRANSKSFVVADMPFLSADISAEETVKNAGKLVQASGVDAVKIEGGSDNLPFIRAVIRAGIPVMGHLGLTPQKILMLGKYGLQGKTSQEAARLIEEARKLEESGVFSIVLECVPSEVARQITSQLKIPTIGIGAGIHCDGQILVSHDLLGWTIGEKTPKFVKKYADLNTVMKEAFNLFKEEILEGKYPGPQHSY